MINPIRFIKAADASSAPYDIHYEKAFDAVYEGDWLKNPLALYVIEKIEGLKPALDPRYFQDANNEIWSFRELSGGMKAFLLLINGVELPNQMIIPGHFIGDNIWWWICYASNFYEFKTPLGLEHVIWLWSTSMPCRFTEIDTGRIIDTPKLLTRLSWKAAHGGAPNTDTPPAKWLEPDILKEWIKDHPVPNPGDQTQFFNQ